MVYVMYLLSDERFIVRTLSLIETAAGGVL